MDMPIIGCNNIGKVYFSSIWFIWHNITSKVISYILNREIQRWKESLLSISSFTTHLMQPPCAILLRPIVVPSPYLFVCFERFFWELLLFLRRVFWFVVSFETSVRLKEANNMQRRWLRDHLTVNYWAFIAFPIIIIKVK